MEISPNVWKAEATEQILQRNKISQKEPKGGDRRFSDRDRRDDWDKGKAQLEQALKSGQERDFYRRQLEKLGYQITSVNYDKADYAEYEVVKGNQTYEVQIELDKNSSKARKVEIGTNMWKAEGTERALRSGKS